MHPSLQDYIRSTVLRSEVGSQAPLEGVQVREVVVGHGADQPVRGHGAYVFSKFDSNPVRTKKLEFRS